MHVGIVAQKGNDSAAVLADDLAASLRAADVRVGFDDATATTLDADSVPFDALSECDLVVSIGGDGTFLYAARGARGTPVLGVNLGEVGFLNAVGPEEAIDVVREEVAAFREGDLHVRESPRIAASGDGWACAPAANEVVVQGPRRGHGGGVHVEVSVDGSHYTEGDADGVLVSTPTGSSAYNLSERGPLVHPGVRGLVINEMNPTHGMPPLVVPLDSEIAVTVTDAEEAVVVSDGRSRQPLSPPAKVTVRTTDPPVRIAGPPGDFFQALGKLD